MAVVLTLCGSAALLAAAWGIFRLTYSADRVVNQGRLMLESIRGTTAQVHRMAQDGVKAQRDLVSSIGTVSTAAAGSLSAMAGSASRNLGRMAGAVERATATLEAGGGAVLAEMAATIRAAREEVIPRAGAILDETRGAVAGVRPVLDEAQATLATTREGIAGVAVETRATIAEVRPTLEATEFLLRQGGEIAQSGANIAKYYEKMILHPSLSQKAKGWIKLFLGGLTVWGNL